ncbi:putative metalloprotease CJM1_0395 family protein [Aeromonas allosaccharophila]|uniref:Metalloprotease CJM1_0395 family protein n=1 Tax=Aeromonas allosaccharophila TaxID=656 RepID=A0AAX3NTA7_9GAMM|nr:putative metalloprotease CJM1_0395 family protein [Aeromonas allosaccharophila]WED76914.1 putative metalloprotease CJM1_0395 family protein [Aeromonas allosaccharophila]
MNINVSLPPLIPTQLQPQVEAARTDNRRAELIPQARQGQASSAESEVGSQKEKSKAGQASSNQSSQNSRETGQPAPTTLPDNRFVEATGEDGQRKQQDPKQQQRQEQQVQDLIERDQEVRTHEQAHQSAGGEYASSPTYQFTQGPDGKRYATGGEVQIDTSAVPGDPAATIAKMQQIRSAALAPAEPSAQDLAVARSAAASEAKARKELMAEQSAKSGGVLSAYMDKRNSVIAGHYQQAVNPAANQSLSLHI